MAVLVLPGVGRLATGSGALADRDLWGIMKFSGLMGFCTVHDYEQQAAQFKGNYTAYEGLKQIRP
jgi:hypothetical protein